jgi:mono/diheme cytochrome c family protein
MKKLTIVFFTIMLTIIACKHEILSPGTNTPPIIITDSGSGNTGGSGSTPNDTVCFNSQVLPLYQGYCGSIGCHSGSRPAEGVDLTTYANIMRGISANNPSGSKYFTVLTGSGENQMPPANSPQLTTVQIAIIQKWITQGALNTQCVTTVCDTTKFTYTNSVQLIYATYCNGCHGVAPGSANVFLGDYAGAKNIAVTMQQQLLNAINYTSASSAQNMPPGGKLSTCDISTITKWINKGTPQ